MSFDEPLNTDWDGNELLLSDVLGTDSDVIYRHLEEEVYRKLLHTAVNRLSPRELEDNGSGFGLCGAREKTQKRWLILLGISQSYISRSEKRIIKRLRKEICCLE